jgi:hypothetical protein
LVCCLLLTELSLTQLTKCTCRSQLLLQALQPKIRAELTRLIRKLCALQAVLSHLATLSQSLLLSLKLCSLIKLLRLKASLCPKTLRLECRLKISLTLRETRLLVSQRSLKTLLSHQLTTRLLRSQVLLTDCETCLLISQRSLKPSLSPQLLNTKASSKVLLTSRKPSSLIELLCLHLSRTVRSELLLSLLERLLTTRGFNTA